MIEGLRFLPQVQTQREEGGWFLTCDDCPNHDVERRIFRCGWIPERERRGGMGEYPGAKVCPGYTTGLPEVTEAARALSWRRDGQLRERYDDPLTDILRDCVDLLDISAKSEDRDRLKRQAAKAREG